MIRLEQIIIFLINQTNAQKVQHQTNIHAYHKPKLAKWQPIN